MADWFLTGEIEYQVLPVFVQLSDQDSPDDFRAEAVLVSLLILHVILADVFDKLWDVYNMSVVPSCSLYPSV